MFTFPPMVYNSSTPSTKMLCYSLVPFAVVFIGSTLFALQQLSGINAVFYFSSTVFRSAGVSSNLANAFIGIANLLGKSFFPKLHILSLSLSLCMCVYLFLQAVLAIYVAQI